MATHDYDIPNQTGAAVRADLNAALAAIVTNNAGDTEPSPVFPHMWWPDTTAMLLKMRNAANTAWITLGPLNTAGFGMLVAANNLSEVNAASARTNLGLVTVAATGAYSDLTGKPALGTAAAGNIGSDVQAFDAATAKTNQPQSFTKSQHAAPVAVTSSGGHITLDLSLSNVFTHTMTENTVLDNPAGMTAGRAVHLIVTQHASSPKTMAFGGYWKFAGGTAPALTATN
ncbi:MAG: hypothetical protein HQL34_09755, partial [Alphaproteobacteria bacterium]|nr:hypothetical protein [Alphaproteobacteria bacterium]